MQLLGGMIAGNPAQAYQQSRLRGQQVDTGDAEASGDAAFGRALQQLYSPGPPGAQPMPTVPPGQPSMPQGGLPMGGGIPSPQGGGAPPMPGGPQMPAGAMPPRPPMPMPQGGGPPVGGPPMQPGMPPGGGGPSQGPNFGQPGGGIGWQQAVQAVVKANPGIEQNPRALARAVDHFMPIMNQQSLAQWRQMQAQSRRRPELELMDQFYANNPDATPEEAAKFFAEQVKGGQVRKDIVGAQQTGAGERTDKQIAGRAANVAAQQAGAGERTDKNIGSREKIAANREQRLQSKADFDREFKTKSLKLAEDRFANTKTKQERDAAFREEKEKLTAHYNELKARISAVAAGATTDKQTQELEKSYKEAVKNLESSFMNKKTNKDMKTGPGELQAYPVPPERRNDPDGTTYNNGQYKKQGDQMVPVQQ